MLVQKDATPVCFIPVKDKLYLNIRSTTKCYQSQTRIIQHSGAALFLVLFPYYCKFVQAHLR